MKSPSPRGARSSSTVLHTLALAVVIFVYELPYGLTLAKTGWTPLPPVVAYPADQVLYLNLSVIKHASPAEVINPWYGRVVRAVDVPHLRFPATFRLFSIVHKAFQSWTLAMLVWNAIWVGLAYVAAVFCLRCLLPDAEVELVLILGFALVVLQSPLVFASAFVRLPSLRGCFGLTLPYIRFAYPQVVLPALLAYWGLLARALRSSSRRDWVWMGLLQFWACVTFPYAVPLMAVATLTALAITYSWHQEKFSWVTIVLFACISSALDLSYLLIGGVGRSQGNVKLLLEFHPELLLPSFRPYVIVLLILSGIVLLSRTSLAARATAAGAAFASAFCGLADVFTTKESLTLSHFSYLVALPTLLAFFVLAWPFLEAVYRRSVRIALITILGTISLWGAYSNFHNSMPINELQAAALKKLAAVQLTSRDLVVAPAEMSDDISCWIPLVSDAKVLYTPDAQNVLSAAEIQAEHSLRQAVYLDMQGHHPASLLALTDLRSGSFGFLPLFTEREYLASSRPADRVRGQLLVRERLLPVFTHLQSQPTIAGEIFRGLNRVVVIDDNRHPLFDESALAKWIDISSVDKNHGVRVLIGTPRLASTGAAGNQRSTPR